MNQALKPCGARLLVRDVFSMTTASGLHLPEIAKDRRKVTCGEVLAVGDGVPRVDPSGRIRTPIAALDDDRVQFEAGNYVYFMVGSGVTLDVDGESFVIVKTDEVLAIGPTPTPFVPLLPVGDDEPRLTPESFE